MASDSGNRRRQEDALPVNALVDVGMFFRCEFYWPLSQLEKRCFPVGCCNLWRELREGGASCLFSVIFAQLQCKKDLENKRFPTAVALFRKSGPREYLLGRIPRNICDIFSDAFDKHGAGTGLQIEATVIETFPIANKLRQDYLEIKIDLRISCGESCAGEVAAFFATMFNGHYGDSSLPFFNHKMDQQ